MHYREAWRIRLAGFLIALAGCGDNGVGAVDTSHPAFSLPDESYGVLLWHGRQRLSALPWMSGYGVPSVCFGHDGALTQSETGAMLLCDLGTPAAARDAVREIQNHGGWSAEIDGSMLRATRGTPPGGKGELRQRRWFVRSVGSLAASKADIEFHFDLRHIRDKLQTEVLVRVAPGLPSFLGLAIAVHPSADGGVERVDASIRLARTPIGIVSALDSPTDSFALESSVNPEQYWVQRFDAARYLEAVLAPKDMTGGIVAPAIRGMMQTLRDDRLNLRGLVACVGVEWAVTRTKSGHWIGLGTIRDRDALLGVIGGLVRTGALFGVTVRSKHMGSGRLYRVSLRGRRFVGFVGKERFGIAEPEAEEELVRRIESPATPAAPRACEHPLPGNKLLGRAVLSLESAFEAIGLELEPLLHGRVRLTCVRTPSSIDVHACTGH